MASQNNKAKNVSPQKGQNAPNMPNTPESSKSQRVPKPKLDADYVYTAPKKTNSKRKLEGTDSVEEPSPKKPQFKGSDSKENYEVKKEETLSEVKSEPKHIRIRPSKFHTKPEPLTVNGKKIGRPRKYLPNGPTPIKNGTEDNLTNGTEERLTNGNLSGISQEKDQLQTPKRQNVVKEKSEDIDPVSISDDPENSNEWNDSFLNNSHFNEEDNFIAENDRKVSQQSNKKPTLMTFIIRALSEHPDGMSGLTDIYEYIRNASEHYRYLKTEWRSSVRNCLSSSRRFMKHPRPINSHKQRGNLWGLNRTHPANIPLLDCPKDASKFVSRDSPTPSSSYKRFIYPNSESPIDNISETSNLSVDDSRSRSIHKSSLTPVQTRKVQISYSNPTQNNTRYTTVNSTGQLVQSSNGYISQYSNTPPVNQVVYYYPPKQVGVKKIENVSFSVGEKVYEPPQIPNDHSELARLLATPTTPQLQPPTETPSNYMTYGYDNIVPSIQQNEPYFLNNHMVYDEQENYLPKPLTSVPEECVGKDEYEKTSRNSVYMQL